MSLKKKTLKKAISMVTALTTIVWLSGISMFAVSVNVASAAIVDGALISSNATNPDGTPTLASLDVYIVKLVGAKKFKRLILNPQVFESYQHFNWNSVQEVDQSIVDQYATSNLIRVDQDPAEKIFGLAPDGDTGSKSWVNLTSTQFLTEGGADADSVYVINSTDAGNYTAVGDVTTVAQLTTFLSTGVLPGGLTGEATVSVSASTPASTVVAQGAQNVVFTKINFSAGATGYTVSKIIVTRSGVANDTDVSAVKLYDGATQVGSSQAINTNTHKASFSSLNIAVDANSTKTITVKGNISATAGTTNIILGVAQASDITSTASSLTGSFPANGNAMSITSGVTVGQVTVDVLATPAATNIISGSTEQHVASIKFTANASEALKVNSFKMSQVGTAGAADISNIVVKYGSEVLATIAELNTSNAAVVVLSPVISLNASASKTVDVYVDVASGINTSRTVQFEVTQADDVSATGANSQGDVTVVAAVAFAEQGAQHTISQGSLTTAIDATDNPAAGNIVKGSGSRVVTALRFSTGSTEGARLTQIKLTGAGTATPTDVSNFIMYKDGVEIATGSISGSTSSYTVQFGTNTVNSFDEPGLFDVAASGNTDVVIKADISSAATATRTVILNVSAATDVKADGLSSKKDVPSASITGTTTGSTLTITASGGLSVAKNAGSPAAETIGKGITGKLIAKFDLTADSGEDITVSSVTMRAYKNGTGTGTVAATGDITNMKVKIGVDQVGATVASPSSGVGAFSINKTITAGTSITLDVYADIPTGTTATSVHIDLPGAGTIADDITSTGVSSTVDLAETGSATGNLMTIAAPAVTASMSGTPAASNKVVNSTASLIGKVLLTAGSAEDVKVNTLKLSFDDAAGLATASSANTQLRNVKLFKSGTTTQVGSTVSVITDGTADYANFTGLDLTVTKSQTQALDVKSDIVAGSGTTYYAGIFVATDVTGTGLQSSTAVSSASGTFPAVSAGVTVQASGTLVNSVAADSPVNANIAVGGTDTLTNPKDVEMAKFKFTSQYEAVKIKTITLTRSGGADADFVKVNLYADGAKVGADGYVSSGTVTFNFATGSEIVVDADGSKTVTAKADLNGVGGGVTHADAPILKINAATDVTAEGSQSGVAIVPTGTATPAAKTLYKTIVSADVELTVVPSNLAASSSTAQKVLALKLTNGGKYDATITKLTITPSYTATDLGDAGYAVYWNDDLTLLTGSNVAGDTTSGTGTTLTITGNNTIAANSSRILYVVADTSGSTTNNTFQLNVSAVADLGWTPDGGSEVTTLTKTLPTTTAPSFKY
ncbi:MAG: hypothetical protein WC788_03885 [Candidatus Paceibacterota bacterium]|jgi:hypothetical protein